MPKRYKNLAYLQEVIAEKQRAMGIQPPPPKKGLIRRIFHMRGERHEGVLD